jgi:hypothetical protein
MAKLYATLAVDADSVSAVAQYVRSQFDLVSDGGGTLRTLGLYVQAYAAPEEFLHGVPSADPAVLEGEAFYREFDVSRFRVFVDLYCRRESPMSECLHVLADVVGKTISKGLGLRVLVFFDGTNVPYCVYSGGVKAREFPSYSRAFLQTRSWRPAAPPER